MSVSSVSIVNQQNPGWAPVQEGQNLSTNLVPLAAERSLGGLRRSPSNLAALLKGEEKVENSPELSASPISETLNYRQSPCAVSPPQRSHTVSAPPNLESNPVSTYMGNAYFSNLGMRAESPLRRAVSSEPPMGGRHIFTIHESHEE